MLSDAGFHPEEFGYLNARVIFGIIVCRCSVEALGFTIEEKPSMMTFVLRSLAQLHRDEAGQGLVEYLLILALVAFAATAGMGSLASGLNSAFAAISSILGVYI